MVLGKEYYLKLAQENDHIVYNFDADFEDSRSYELNVQEILGFHLLFFLEKKTSLN